MSDLTFRAFQAMNRARCEAKFDHGVFGWTPELWALAIAGEAGELANLVKKVVRGDFTLEEKRDDTLKELADIITYCDLMMTRLGASTDEALIEKFNEVSERIGYTEPETLSGDPALETAIQFAIDHASELEPGPGHTYLICVDQAAMSRKTRAAFAEALSKRGINALVLVVGKGPESLKVYRLEPEQ